ncbi:MAG: hypothetical protein RLZZ584_1096 [Pseudomonadota bacterium]
MAKQSEGAARPSPWLIPWPSVGLWRQDLLSALLGVPVSRGWWPTGGHWLGWGRKRSGRLAAWCARLGSGHAVQLEDGFLRSYGTGDRYPPLSLVVDAVGIYYDSTRPSALENMLATDDDLLSGVQELVAQARALILAHGLSKYNHAPDWSGPDAALAARDTPGPAGARHVLVVDQTAGDLSVKLGGANAESFLRMLDAAQHENPHATIWVKTHPEVSAGRKAGYLTAVRDGGRIRVLRTALNPHSLIARMDRVYTVSSTMGFEALLAGRAVTCFGLPWYAGWGATDDRQTCPRRGRSRSVDELFAAAYLHYSRYLDPQTRAPGSILDVIEWLRRQRQAAGHWPIHDQPARSGRVIGIGFRRWKQAHVDPILGPAQQAQVFVPDAGTAALLHPGPADVLLVWGSKSGPEVQALADRSACSLWRMEDGFVRSVGLGSDLIRPHSLVLDRRGIYFDPSRESDLEHLLATTHFSDEELRRAAEVRQLIVQHGLTKYNLEPRAQARWNHQGRRVVLVPGQVEDDASIRLGATSVCTNAGLLQAARRASPDAYIVYKPHPDVMSGNRRGALDATQALADHVETQLSVVSCIDACDEVHTMTSLTGFDALLREKGVFTYGVPFYSGWGLTQDMAQGAPSLMRRRRRLSLDELVAGTLLRYPVYWDWELRGYTTCEAVLMTLLHRRSELERDGGLERLRSGVLRRQWRKLIILAASWRGSVR